MQHAELDAVHTAGCSEQRWMQCAQLDATCTDQCNVHSWMEQAQLDAEGTDGWAQGYYPAGGSCRALHSWMVCKDLAQQPGG